MQRQRLWQRLAEAGIAKSAQPALLASGRLQLAVSDQNLATAAAQPLKLSQWLPADAILWLDQQPLPAVPPRRYWQYHKPRGIDCNLRASDPASLWHLLQQFPPGVFAVGRLDKDSEGLLLLTNDGQFANQLLHPNQHHQKTYQVQIDQDVSAEQLSALQQGAVYQVGQTTVTPRPCQARLLAPRLLELQLTEGKNRQIRYMCRAVGLKVLRLQRTAVGALQLGDLPVGAVAELNASQQALALGSDVVAAPALSLTQPAG